MAGSMAPLAQLPYVICYNIGMTEEELKTISSNIKEKLGDESFSMISDDLGQIITGRELMEKDIKSRDSEISDLKDKNQKLVDANASLFKQIPSVHTAETKADDDEMPLKNVSLRSVFDKNGNFIK